MRALVLSSLLVLALTGCKPVWDPTFMPSGYAHHHKDYKSPPGPEAADIGYAYTRQSNQKVLSVWSNAAADLLQRAKTSHIHPNGPVYLRTDLHAGAFQAAFDSALREELRARGVVLTNDEQRGTTLFYSAYDPAEAGQPESMNAYNGDAHHPNEGGDLLPPSQRMELVLAALEEGRIGKKVSGLYDVPLYGFKPAGYVPLHERPLRGHTETSDLKDMGDGYNN